MQDWICFSGCKPALLGILGVLGQLKLVLMALDLRDLQVHNFRAAALHACQETAECEGSQMARACRAWHGCAVHEWKRDGELGWCLIGGP